MRFASIIILVVCVISYAPPATTELNPGDAAALSTGILLGTQALQVLRTNSSLTVVVERYKDTQKVPGLDEDIAVMLPVEKRRTPPFKLGKPAAIRRLMTAKPAGFSLSAASNVQSTLKAPMDRLVAIGATAKAEADRLRPGGAGYSAEVKDYDAVTIATGEAVLFWMQFSNKVSALERQSVVTEGELNGAKILLNDLRAKLKVVEGLKFSDDSIDAIQSLLHTFYLAFTVARVAPPAHVALVVAPDSTLQSASNLAKTRDTYAGQLAEMFAAIPKLTAKVKTAANYDKDTHGLRFDILDKRSHERFLSTISPSTLAVGQTAASIEALLRITPGDSIFAIADVVASAINASYANTLATSNLGPLKNEMTQGLITMGAQLDEVLENANDPDRWLLMNQVSSKGGLGNHTAIVYMDNAATPVLKEAEFDPTAFIKATGLVYERAFSVTSTLFGLPETSGTEGAGAGGVNVYDIRSRIRNAERGKQQFVNELAAAALKLADLHSTVAARDWTEIKAELTALATAITDLN